MQPANYPIVAYRPDHKDRVIEFQKALWSPSAELNAAVLDWKHLRNPYLREPLIYLAMDGEQIVGMRGFFGAEWQCGPTQQSIVVPCAGDLLVAPAYRNRGLVTMLMTGALNDLADKGYSCVLSMSAGSTTLLAQMAMGWRSIGSLQPMQCTTREQKHFLLIRGLLRKSPLAVSAYRRFRGLDTPQPPASPVPTGSDRFAVFDRKGGLGNRRVRRHVSVARHPRPREMAELVGRLGTDGRLRHVRDERYFAWRFQNPLASYRFLFWDDASLEGYLVLQSTSRSWMPYVNLVDWEANSRQTRVDLLEAARQLVGHETLNVWSATLSEEAHQILEAAGFHPVETTITRNPPSVLVRPVGDARLDQEWLLGGRRLLDMGSWDLRMIYSEGF